MVSSAINAENLSDVSLASAMLYPQARLVSEKFIALSGD